MQDIKNLKLNRMLTQEELTAVKWYATYIFGAEPGHLRRKDIISYLIINGNISRISEIYKKHVGDRYWEAKQLYEAKKKKMYNRFLGKTTK